jgi:hypothetical protein
MTEQDSQQQTTVSYDWTGQPTTDYGHFWLREENINFNIKYII